MASDNTLYNLKTPGPLAIYVPLATTLLCTYPRILTSLHCMCFYRHYDTMCVHMKLQACLAQQTWTVILNSKLPPKNLILDRTLILYVVLRVRSTSEIWSSHHVIWEPQMSLKMHLLGYKFKMPPYPPRRRAITRTPFGSPPPPCFS